MRWLPPWQRTAVVLAAVAMCTAIAVAKTPDQKNQVTGGQTAIEQTTSTSCGYEITLATPTTPATIVTAATSMGKQAIGTETGPATTSPPTALLQSNSAAYATPSTCINQAQEVLTTGTEQVTTMASIADAHQHLAAPDTR